MSIRSFTVFMLLTLFATVSFADKIKVISTPDAPAAIGPYSQAVQFSDFVFLAGQIPLDPSTSDIVNTAEECVEGDEVDNSCVVRLHTEQVMDNIKAVLAAAKLDWCDVAMSTVYLADLNDFGVFNSVYGEYFDDCGKNYYPARATVQTGIPRSGKLEIAVIAVKQKGK